MPGEVKHITYTGILMTTAGLSIGRPGKGAKNDGDDSGELPQVVQ